MQQSKAQQQQQQQQGLEQQALEQQALAERVRSALIDCALAAYADAGVRGLCAEGAWEAAVTALRKLDLESVWEGTYIPAPND